MTNDDHLSNQVSITAKVTDSGLSANAKSRAVSAMDRLLGSAFDVPAAKLEAIASEIRANSAQKVKLIAAKGDAEVGQQHKLILSAVSDDAAAREVKKVANKRKIAERALEFLAESEATPEEFDESPELDEDWLNCFEDYAEKASSERLQTHWARVLAGEIRSPRTFSLATLRFLAEVDQDIAELFERETKYWIAGGFIIKPKKLEGQHLLDLSFLEEVGLLQDVNSNLMQDIDGSSKNLIFVPEGNFQLLLKARSIISFPVIRISRIGREILSILPPKDHFAVLERLFQNMKGEVLRASIQEVKPSDHGLIFRDVKVLKEESGK